MLQRIHDSLAKWVIVIVLGLIAFSFIFWGVDFGMTGVTNFAAKVNGEDIPVTEFDQALQQRQNQYQQIYRSELPEDMRRELRRATIDELVANVALKQRVDQQGYRASDERVTQSIRDIAVFQVDGEFDLNVYRGILANQGLTPTGFEELQREALAIGDLESGITSSTFLTPAEFRRYIELYNQRREVAYALFEPEAFTEGVTIDDAAIATRYEQNQVNYQTPETVDLEYIEVTLADIAATVEVTEEELRAAYEQERERFETVEERRARHILIEAEDGDDAARAEAEAVIARIRGGEDFAAVAAEVSDDAGTKAQGGDLGWNGRGTFPAEFEEALFALSVGDISEPVRTDSGFHVIRLDEVRAGDLQSFEDVREELLAELQTREAENEFYDLANELGDAAFDAYDDLAAVAAATNLPIKMAAGFPRTGDSTVFANSAAVVQAAFADEIVDTGRNSELIELAEDHVLVLRVTEHHVPTTRPLDEVREQIREELTRQRAIELAEEAAQAYFTELEQGGEPAERAEAHGGTFTPAAWITRTDPNVRSEVLATAFGMPKLEAGSPPQRETVGLANGGQAVVILSGVQAGEAASMSQTERDQRQQQLEEQAARAEVAGYAGNVRAAADVRIPDQILDPPLF